MKNTMKNIRKIVAALLVALFALSSVAALAEGTVKTTAVVNLRSGAGKEYTVVGNANANEYFAYNKTAKDSRGVVWYRVNNNGKGAWISSMYSAVVGDTQRVKSNGINNLRKGPGLDFAIVGNMTDGQTARYLGETKLDSRNVAWYKISFGGNTCWISSKYASLH